MSLQKLKTGFAKIQGEDFEYFVQVQYSLPPFLALLSPLFVSSSPRRLPASLPRPPSSCLAAAPSSGPSLACALRFPTPLPPPPFESCSHVCAVLLCSMQPYSCLSHVCTVLLCSMQSYSIILGRNSKKAAVDLDLAGVGAAGASEADTEVAGRNISRSHARIYYDFPLRCFMLEVFGKNGVSVNGAVKEAGAPPVPLRSQDLIQIADRKMYFLLPTPKRKAEGQMNGGKRRRTKS